MEYAVFKASEDSYVLGRRGLTTFYKWEFPTPGYSYWLFDYQSKHVHRSEEAAIVEMNKLSGEDRLIIARGKSQSIVKRVLLFLLEL